MQEGGILMLLPAGSSRGQRGVNRCRDFSTGELVSPWGEPMHPWGQPMNRWFSRGVSRGLQLIESTSLQIASIG